VHDQVDVVDVDAPGGDVGGDEHPRPAGGEGVQRPLPRVLREVAVQRTGGHPGAAELAGQPVGAVLGADEDQGPARPGRDLRRDLDLVLVPDGEGQVVHGRDRRGRAGDRDRHRVAQVRPGQPVDPAVQGGREQQPLAAGRGEVEDPGHVGQESEVGHVVGLVDGGDRHAAERALPLPDEVEQPARGGDQQVDAAAQRGDLPGDRRAAEDGEDPDADRLAERGQRLLHLAGQLAGRHQDETPGPAGGAAGGTGHQAGQHGQAEGERLAGAGLGPAEHVPAGQRVRHRPGLDRERRRDAAPLQAGQQRLRQPQRGEVGRPGRGVQRRGEGELQLAHRLRAGRAGAPGRAGAARAAGRGVRGTVRTGRAGQAGTLQAVGGRLEASRAPGGPAGSSPAESGGPRPPTPTTLPDPRAGHAPADLSAG
jgi:hypothetical protein